MVLVEEMDYTTAMSSVIAALMNIGPGFGDVGPSFILGSKGGIRMSPLQIYQDRHGSMVDVTPQVPRQRENPHTTEVKAFIKAIRENAPSPVPGEEALAITKIFDAVYKSTKTGSMVSIK